ncbi:DUF2321 domain-containing protein [Bacillus thuringiensis]|uniref:DUF2321 domain-containing protein n=1 Tax=Bacillus thuringiensis subsp. higo TaxID=132266 RepID=A0A9X6LQW5_BACUH|nr:DUF2321 domain-containing protein [Bacillus thuringiensis]OUB49948.1 hypothetical protein BK716_15835 [Bacillus thuringiensis serovar higo]
MADQQYYQLICKNGHQISFWHKLHGNSTKFCEKCGSNTIETCQNCEHPIEGYYYVSGFISLGPETFPVPFYCKHCGNPYPWTTTILENAVELVSLDEELDENAKEIIKNAIPDLLVDTPTTPLAVARYKKHIAKGSQLLKSGLHNLLSGAVTDAVNNSLFG